MTNTPETFIYKYEPKPLARPSYIIDQPYFKVYRAYDHMSETHKTYVMDGTEETEINGGAYNTIGNLIAGLTDEAAADKIRTLFRQGRIKPPTVKSNKKYSHR